MKIIQSIMVLVLFKASCLFGEVRFEFVYADKAGTGFHLRPEAKKVLKEVGELIGGKWLKQHNAHIVVNVISKENLNGEEVEYLAKVNPVEYKDGTENNFQHSFLGKKIILGQKNNGPKFDTHLTVNFEPKYSFVDVVNSDEYDFKSVIIHELTHSLGFKSKDTKSCPTTIEEAMAHKVEEFMQKLFRFGINEIERKTQTITANELAKELTFYESMDIDVETMMWQRIKLNSSLNKYEVLLNLAFKEGIQTKIPSARGLELHRELSEFLVENGMTMEEFIMYQFEGMNLMFEVFELGVKQLMNKVFDANKEAKLKRYFKLRLQFNESFETKGYLFDDKIDTLFEVLLFCEKYFKGGSISKKEKTRLINLIKKHALSLGMTIEEYSQFILNTRKRDMGYTYFDQFVVTYRGERFFDQQMDKHIIDYCFPKKGVKHEVLYFNGPKVLKYIGKPIPLNGLDVSHISMRGKSIMNANLGGYGLKSREWDAQTTAIMLELGYKIDNDWTRLWKVNPKEKKITLELK